MQELWSCSFNLLLVYRTSGEQMKTKICKKCGASYVPKKKDNGLCEVCENGNKNN